MWPSSISTNEKAPSRAGSTASSARSRARPSELASGWRPSSSANSSATTSLSLVMAPGSMPASAARASVFTRLPLWPRAKVWAPTSRYTGWALRQLLDPVVE